MSWSTVEELNDSRIEATELGQHASAFVRKMARTERESGRKALRRFVANLLV